MYTCVGAIPLLSSKANDRKISGARARTMPILAEGPNIILETIDKKKKKNINEILIKK